MEDTFKLADEVRAENRGEGWDAETETAIPAPEAPAEVVPEAAPEAPAEVAPEVPAPEIA